MSSGVTSESEGENAHNKSKVAGDFIAVWTATNAFTQITDWYGFTSPYEVTKTSEIIVNTIHSENCSILKSKLYISVLIC